MVDTTSRGTWWSITVNNPTEQDRQTIHGPAPRWLRMVKGQDEIGEKSGILHIQAVANTTQTRMSSLMEWLPRAHIQLAHNSNALANYVFKEETAVEGTRFEHNYVNQLANGPLTMAQVMMKIAEVANVENTRKRLRPDNDNVSPLPKLDEVYADEFWAAVEILLGQDENLVAFLTQPQYQRAWVKTRRVWLMKLAVDRQTEISVAGLTGDAGVSGTDSSRNELISLP